MSDRTPRRERRNSQNPDMRNRPPAAAERSMRFLLISSRARNKSAIYSSVRPEVKVMEYSYDSTTLEDLQADVSEALNGKKVVIYAANRILRIFSN